jgi:hypothetical protein
MLCGYPAGSGCRVARRRIQRKCVLAGLAITSLLASGAAAALANFVKWPVGLGLGALSAGVGLIGTIRWERHTARTAIEKEWNSVTDPGPGSDPASAGNSVLAPLNPDLEIVAFSPSREPDVRRLLRWCNQPSSQRVWLVTGDAGCGKTRLLIEATSRLDAKWMYGWVRHGKGAAAVALAVAAQRPVLLIVDDADTRADLGEIFTGLPDSESVRVVVAARETGTWWLRLRESLDANVDAVVPARPQTPLATLTPDNPSQQQRFNQAVQQFARAWDVGVPAVTLVPPSPPAPLVLIHAAAAVAVHDSLSGAIDLESTLDRLFAIEESWWQQSALDAGIPSVGLPTLRSAVVAAALLGADGLDDAVAVLRHLPGLTAASEDLLRHVALWLRRLYPNKAGGWLSPHLPARLTEHYIADQLAANPSLVAAVAAAATAAGPTP